MASTSDRHHPPAIHVHRHPEGLTTSPAVAEPFADQLRSPRTKLVFLYLRLRREACIEELQESLDMPALTLYPVLDTPMEKGLVCRTDDGYACQSDHPSAS